MLHRNSYLNLKYCDQNIGESEKTEQRVNVSNENDNTINKIVCLFQEKVLNNMQS